VFSCGPSSTFVSQALDIVTLPHYHVAMMSDAAVLHNVQGMPVYRVVFTNIPLGSGWP